MLMFPLVLSRRIVSTLDHAAKANTSPWFFKELPEPTSEPKELRACADESRADEDVTIEAVWIYVNTTCGYCLFFVGI